MVVDWTSLKQCCFCNYPPWPEFYSEISSNGTFGSSGLAFWLLKSTPIWPFFIFLRTFWLAKFIQFLGISLYIAAPLPQFLPLGDRLVTGPPLIYIFLLHVLSLLYWTRTYFRTYLTCTRVPYSACKKESVGDSHPIYHASYWQYVKCLTNNSVHFVSLRSLR